MCGGDVAYVAPVGVVSYHFILTVFNLLYKYTYLRAATAEQEIEAEAMSQLAQEISERMMQSQQ